MEFIRVMKFSGDDIVEAAENISQRKPGRQSILFAHGVEVVPIRTVTLPPADHTNCYLIGDPDGEFIIVDPAVRYREDMENLAEAVDRHNGTPIAVAYTHSHSDHLADADLLKEAFDLPVWGSEYTSRSGWFWDHLDSPCNRRYGRLYRAINSSKSDKSTLTLSKSRSSNCSAKQEVVILYQTQNC